MFGDVGPFDTGRGLAFMAVDGDAVGVCLRRTGAGLGYLMQRRGASRVSVIRLQVTGLAQRPHGLRQMSTTGVRTASRRQIR